MKISDLLLANKGDSFSGLLLLVNEIEFKNGSNGKPYIRFNFSDDSNRIGGKLWNSGPEVLNGIVAGDVVEVNGIADPFNGKMDLEITGLVKRKDMNSNSFLPCSKFSRDELKENIKKLISNIKDSDYLFILNKFFSNDGFMDRFLISPAAKRNHHSFIGGLAEHTLNVSRISYGCFRVLNNIRSDLVLSGALLHDVGKIEELSYERGFKYTEKGELLGHITIGINMLYSLCRDGNREKLDLLAHIILSHHADKDKGSPIEPRFPEAVIVSYADRIDASIGKIENGFNLNNEK